MDSSEAPRDKEYEILNDAILKAIISSKEVKEVLQEFKTKKLINNMAVLNLILSIEELSELIFPKPSSYDYYKLEPQKNKKAEATKKGKGKGRTSRFVIDGRKLTANEILFEEFCRGNFDEVTWMKKARIRI